MAEAKRALWVVFQPRPMPSTEELRAQFTTSYPVFADLEAVEFKCWWVDQSQGQWGAFYLFRSAAALEEYLASDRWTKVIPQKYGCVPTWRVLEAGLVLSKQIITQAAGSWQSS
ncbi:MAG: hypothetical protein AB1814_06180 [Thermodesulfobacteriota bacterium]